MGKQEKRSVACGTLREEPRREGMKRKMNERRNEQTNEKRNVGRIKSLARD